MSGLLLVHDIQDAQLLDGHGEKIGRVDALLLELEDGRPPRIVTILVGGPVREERIGRWALHFAQLLRRIAGMHTEGVSRIPFSAVRRIGNTIDVDVDGDTLESGHLERWLCDHVVRRVPIRGGGTA
jgi:sporulation protein YlmC with PRC-barrel domain